MRDVFSLFTIISSYGKRNGFSTKCFDFNFLIKTAAYNFGFRANFTYPWICQLTWTPQLDFISKLYFSKFSQNWPIEISFIIILRAQSLCFTLA